MLYYHGCQCYHTLGNTCLAETRATTSMIIWTVPDFRYVKQLRDDNDKNSAESTNHIQHTLIPSHHLSLIYKWKIQDTKMPPLGPLGTTERGTIIRSTTRHWSLHIWMWKQFVCSFSKEGQVNCIVLPIPSRIRRQPQPPHAPCLPDFPVPPLRG